MNHLLTTRNKNIGKTVNKKIHLSITEAGSKSHWLFALFLFAFSLVSLYAQPAVKWTGNTSSDWNLGANWSGGLPGSDNIVIDPVNYTGAASQPTISANSTFTPKQIQILGGGILTINANLTNSGNIEVNGSTSVLTVTGGTTDIGGIINKDLILYNQASFNFSGGTVDVGSSLTVDKGSTVTMSGAAILIVTANLMIQDKTGATSSLFNMTGGTVTVTSEVMLDGKSTGSRPLLNMSGGTMTVGFKTEWFGNSTDYPHIVVSGGTMTIGNTVGRRGGESSNIDIDVSGTGNIIFQDQLYTNMAGDRVDQAGTSTITFQNVKTWDNFGIYTAAGTSTAIFDGSTTLLNTGSYNFGGVTINPGDLLMHSIPANINVAGDWNNLGGTFNANSKKVTLNGTANQNISAETFYNLEINKPSNTAITGGVVNVTHALTMTSGNFITTAANLLVVTSGATSTSGSALSFVDGPMKKVGSDPFVFPVGDGITWARIAMSAPGLPGDAFTAQYFHAGFGNYTVTQVPNPIMHASDLEYWTFDRTAGTSNVTVKLYWENATTSGIKDCSALRIAHWNGTAWENNNDAVTSTSAGCPTPVAESGDIVTNAVVTSFSPFTFGGGWANPLPVELVSFTAECNLGNVNLNWSTPSEINNSHFLVDRSTDFITWSNITRVTGSGNSNELKNYAYTDPLPGAGTYYYRLTQVDFDGQNEVFDFITVTCAGSSGNDLAEIKIYPNPASEVLSVQLPNSSVNNDFNIEILNYSGQVLTNRLVYANQSSLQSFDISGLGTGIFLVRISGNNLTQTTKLIVSRTGGGKKRPRFNRAVLSE